MAEPHPGASASPVSLLDDFRLLLILVVVFRLTFGIVYQPATFDLYTGEGAPQTVERGMSTFGDLRYYFELAQRSDAGDWPYRDFWFEFPPVWSALFIGLYRLMDVFGGGSYATWATALGFLLTAVDIGNIVLLRRLARRLHGDSIANALPWVYALLAAPVIVPWWTFEPLVALLLLLALWWLLDGRADRAALATALGVLTKYIGVVLLPAVWRLRDRRFALRYTVLSLALPVVVLVLLLLWGGATARASLAAQVNKASYQTVWALIDGNYRTGVFVPPDARSDPDTAYDLTGNPPMIPAWLRLVPFVMLGGYVLARTRRRDDYAVIALVTLTVILLFLWAQGWSPQWVVTLTPLILLSFPGRNGVLVCVLLGFTSLFEYPGLFVRTAGADSVISGGLKPTFTLLVLLRTALLVGVAAALARQLTREDMHEGA